MNINTEHKPSIMELTDEDIRNQYALLSILDGKSAGLLAFNTIFLATISVWLGYVPPNFMHLALDLVFLGLLASCTILLGVIQLRWSRVGESTSELNQVREVRTKRYRKAWLTSVACVCAVIVISLVHTFGTALIATRACGPTCAWFYGEEVFGNLDVRSSRP
jgi:hypothetical protein